MHTSGCRVLRVFTRYLFSRCPALSCPLGASGGWIVRGGAGRGVPRESRDRNAYQLIAGGRRGPAVPCSAQPCCSS